MNKNIFYSLGAVLVWSTLAPIAKMLLNGIPNFEVLAVCAFVAAIFLFFFNIANGSIKKMKEYKLVDYLKMSGLGFIGMFLSNALYYCGLASNMTSQEACILNYLWPIMILIFSCIILHEKLTVMKVIAIVCSFAGIVILSLGAGSTMDSSFIVGAVAVIINAVCYGLFSALNKKADYNQNIAMMIFWLTAGIFAVIAGVIGNVTGLVPEPWVPLGTTEILGLVWLGIAVKALGYLLWAIGLKKASDSAKVANLAYLTPFLSLIMSFFLLGERIKPQALLALVFIVGGILLQYFWDHRKVKK